MSTSKIKRAELRFSMQQQQAMLWCWVAVGTSCALFYDHSSNWTQCSLAGQALGIPGKCCSDAEHPINPDCNKIGYLEDSDRKKGSFITAKIADGFVEKAISFEHLTSEIDQGRVVAFRMKLDVQIEGETKTIYHFVAAAGYEQTVDNQFVTIYDPFFGDVIMPYNRFVNSYKYHGSVTHTFFSIPQKSNHPVSPTSRRAVSDTEETLRDALLRVGDEEHLVHLTKQAQDMTKAQITQFLNNELDENVKLGTIKSIRKLAKQRIMEGKSVFPWDKMEDVHHNEADDQVGGGVW